MNDKYWLPYKKNIRSQELDEQEIAMQKMTGKLQDIINQLSPQQKLIYKLSRKEELKHKEIAERLNISVPTVNNHLTQALQIIRRELKNVYSKKQ